MKSFVALELLRKINNNRQLRQKLKIVIGVGIVGCLIIGALVVWGGIAAFKTASNIGTNLNVQEKISSLETEVQNMPALVKVGCWSTVKSLMNVEIWLEKPVSENYINIKSACLTE